MGITRYVSHAARFRLAGSRHNLLPYLLPYLLTTCCSASVCCWSRPSVSRSLSRPRSASHTRAPPPARRPRGADLTRSPTRATALRTPLTATPMDRWPPRPITIRRCSRWLYNLVRAHSLKSCTSLMHRGRGSRRCLVCTTYFSLASLYCTHLCAPGACPRHVRPAG